MAPTQEQLILIAKARRRRAAAEQQPATPQSSYDQMAATPQRSVVGQAPQWDREATPDQRMTQMGSSPQDKAAADLQRGWQTGNVGEMLSAANTNVRSWWKNTPDKQKLEGLAQIPIEASGAGQIGRLADYVGQKTGNEFLQTDAFKTGPDYNPTADMAALPLNALSWSTRNAAGGMINPRSPMAAVKSAAADVGTNLTMGGSDLAAASVKGARNLTRNVLGVGAPTPPPAAAAAVATPQAPQSAPVQPRQASPGQGSQFSGAFSDGTQWSAQYRPVTLSDGSVALVREITDDTGTTVSHLSMDGEWVKGEPAKTRVSGMSQLSGPETFTSADHAFAAARDDAAGMGGRAAGPSPSPSGAAPQPSPVAPAQPRPPGAGQGAGAAQPVLNAVPVAPVVPKGQIRVAKDTAKILTRIMRSSRIDNADIRGYLPGAVQRYKALNDERVPFAFFLERDLPDHFPQPIAEEVITKLRTWGRERNSATGPQDTSRRTTQQTVKSLRSSQQDYLTDVAKKELFSGSLISQEDQILKSLKETGRKGYEPSLDHARQALDGRRTPTPDEAKALQDLQDVLANPIFEKYVDDATRIRAARDGVDIDQLLKQDPVGAAHWLQSEFRRLSDASEDAITGKPTRMSAAYDDLRDMLLDPLKRAAKGYEGAMNRYGHDYGSKEAVQFGKGTFTEARSAIDTAKKVRQFKKFGKRQQTVALKSIRDEYLNEFRGTPEDKAAKLTRMAQEGSLDFLEQLGARGKRFADAIRKVAKENEQIQAIEQASGSPTFNNMRGADAARDMVQSPINKAVGAFGDKTSWPMTVAGDVVLASSGLPPVLTAGKAATALVDRFGNPSAKQLSRATEGLYGLPQPPTTNALTGPASPPRVRGPRKPPSVPPQEDMATLLAKLDAAEKDAKTRGGPEGKRLLDQIDAERQRLALSGPPKPPTKPNKAGFFGGGDEVAGNVTKVEREAELGQRVYDARAAGWSDHDIVSRIPEFSIDPSSPREMITRLLDKYERAFKSVGLKPSNPQRIGSTKFLSGVGGTEGAGALGGGVIGGLTPPKDQNDDGIIDDTERAAAGFNVITGAISGGILARAGRAGVNKLNAGRPKGPPVKPSAPELPLAKENRVYSPGKPDDLGFITSAENVLANPPARFRDAKALTAAQWRNLMRDGGASKESFQWQIEPALKRLEAEGYTGDIPKAKFEEAMARERGTLSKPPEKTEVTTINGRTREARTERDYGQYVSKGSHANYKQDVLVLPAQQGQGYKSHNWTSENPVGHVRYTNRMTTKGEKVLHVEELQSDLHQEGAKLGYRGDPANKDVRAQMEDASRRRRTARIKYEEWYSRNASPNDPDVGMIGAIRANDAMERIKDPTGRELFREAVEAERRFQQAHRTGRTNQPPRAPLENWEEPFIKYALRQGVEQGVDVVTFPTGKTLHEALLNDGTEAFYDGRLPKHLESVAKSLGVKVEQQTMHIPWKNGLGETVPTTTVPAIRLTPEAKAKLKAGVIMDAKDPGRVVKQTAPKPPPAQAGFGQFGRQIGPPRPPGMKIPAAAAQKGQAAAPITIKKGPRNITVSPEIAEQMKVVRKANADERKAMRKNVMRPDRDELNAPWTEARIAEEEKLADMQAKERARRVGRVARRSTMQRIAKHPTTSTLVGGGALAGAYIGFKTAFPQKQEEPDNPSRPGYWFDKIATKDADTVSRMQRSLHEWGFWPTEKKTRTNGYKLEEWKEPVEMNGRYGTATKDAMKRWLYEVDPYRDPDEPITQEDVERLLAGPKGYQDEDGHWQNPRDRKPIAAR